MSVGGPVPPQPWRRGMINRARILHPQLASHRISALPIQPQHVKKNIGHVGLTRMALIFPGLFFQFRLRCETSLNWWRGWHRFGKGFGRRLTARGSRRPGRSGTKSLAMASSNRSIDSLCLRRKRFFRQTLRAKNESRGSFFYSAGQTVNALTETEVHGIK